MNTEEKAWETTLQILNYSEQTGAKLALKLQARGIPQDLAQQMVDKARAYKLIHDGDYARRLVEREKRKLRGPLRIKETLRAHGLDAQAIAIAIAQAQMTHAEIVRDMAKQALEKKFKKNHTVVERAKKIRFLISQGYDPDTIRNISGGFDNNG